MRCQDAWVEMSAALDGELDPAGASSLREHLDGCPACQIRRDQIAAFDQRLRAPARRALRVPEALQARIAGKLASQLPVPRPPRRRASPLAFAVAFTGAAAAAALAVAGPSSDDATTSDEASNEAAARSLLAGPSTPPHPHTPQARSQSTSAAADRAITSDPSARADSAPLARAAARSISASTAERTSLARAADRSSAPADCSTENDALDRPQSEDPTAPPRFTDGPGTRETCQLAVTGHSPVAVACGAGGLREARRVMRGLVDGARNRGLRFRCRDCHRNEIDFALDDSARERFATLVAAAGA